MEENPGAIVWRNSDFSKLSLDAMQPEAGEPLYVPDYSAPSNVYDPENAGDFTTATVEIDSGMVNNFKVRFTFDDTKLELWTNSIWGGLEAAAGRSKIRPGVLLTTPTSSITFQIEGINASTAFATDFIQVEAIPNGGGATLEDKGFYTVVETGIGVDGNRDTEIDFESSYDRQLLFWLNNDQEGMHASDAVEAEQPNIISADNSDNEIKQQRDLEDLAPLRVNVNPLLIQNTFDTAKVGSAAPGELEVTYRLLLENAAGTSLRLFSANNADSNVIRHVSDENTASIQAGNFFKDEAGPSFSSQQQLMRIDDDGPEGSEGVNTFLFEAIGTAYGMGFSETPTLVFETEIKYADGSTTTKRHEVELDLRDIKSFYTRWDIDYGVNGGATGTDLREDLSFKDFDTPASGTETHVSQVKNESFFSGDDTTVLVHGWNNSDNPNSDDKAAGAETMFKRLYWQGYRGEFVAFNWPTYLSSGNPIDETYNSSEFQAYRSANALKEILGGYRGAAPNLQPVHLLAHSMGNIVAGEALRIWTFELPLNNDPLVTNYVAMEAAVSAGAYGSNDTDALSGRPEPDLYRFWSHGQDDGLTNPSLGTSYYFLGASFASENSVNYYNANDFALLGWVGNNLLKAKVDNFAFPLGEPYFGSTSWPSGYIWFEGDGENVNNDIFERHNADSSIMTSLTLTSPNGRPGIDAYEILAFFAQSASKTIGSKPTNFFDANINLQSFGLLGGNGIRANHSYQFNHDAAETWSFYSSLKGQLGFGATHNVTLAAISNGPVPIKYANSDVINQNTSREVLPPFFLEKPVPSFTMALQNKLFAKLGFAASPAKSIQTAVENYATLRAAGNTQEAITEDQESHDYYFDSLSDFEDFSLLSIDLT